MIKGWIRTTLLDYPNEIASAIFIGGCCFRCPMCHNPELVLNPTALPNIAWDEIYNYLESRKGKITGLVVSGGEPCTWQNLIKFLHYIRPLDVKIKLDTCGYFPETLKMLLQAGLIDYVAMDIKASPDKYARLTGMVNIDLGRINRSIEILLCANISYEFRTTVVRNWITTEDVVNISEWIKGSQKYVLQQFNPRICISQDLIGSPPYPKEVLLEMQNISRQRINEVYLRGI